MLHDWPQIAGAKENRTPYISKSNILIINKNCLTEHPGPLFHS